MSLVRVEGLRRSFGEHVVLDGLDLELAAGERVALRGPNGSGKTTFLRCVLGTITPDAGTISVGDHEAGSLGARSLIGASLSQDRSFYLRLTGRENLVFFARLRVGTRRRAVRRVDELVEELELADIVEERCDRCSTGMLQQLALARALVGEPSVLLLDEPTRSLDPEARERLWDALERRPRCAALIATHQADDVERVTHVVELEKRSRS